MSLLNTYNISHAFENSLSGFPVISIQFSVTLQPELTDKRMSF